MKIQKAHNKPSLQLFAENDDQSKTYRFQNQFVQLASLVCQGFDQGSAIPTIAPEDCSLKNSSTVVDIYSEPEYACEGTIDFVRFVILIL
jgi:hypothetical protein